MGDDTSDDPRDDDPYGYRALVAWLVEQPALGQVRWGNYHVLHAGLHTGWVDVQITAAAHAAALNWCFTIVAPGDEDASGDDPTIIELAHDAELTALWDHEAFDYVAEVRSGPDGVVTPEDEAVLDQASGPTTRRARDGGWTSEAISRALEAWTATHAGRDDIMFVFDEDIEMSQDKLDLLDEIAAGETYDLGDGLQASSSFMDYLLAHPDEAPTIETTLRATLRAEPE